MCGTPLAAEAPTAREERKVVTVLLLRSGRVHEPERAVRAALAIRDELREEWKLEVRITLNTGQALLAASA